jgi:hypothetical protein
MGELALDQVASTQVGGPQLGRGGASVEEATRGTKGAAVAEATRLWMSRANNLLLRRRCRRRLILLVVLLLFVFYFLNFIVVLVFIVRQQVRRVAIVVVLSISAPALAPIGFQWPLQACHRWQQRCCIPLTLRHSQRRHH